MKTVYVIGPYSAGDIITALDNMRIGMRLSAEVMLAGFAPFCPWLDYHLVLQLRDGEKLCVEDYYKYSLAWLLKADCALLDKARMPRWVNSKGTHGEVIAAIENNIPVYDSLAELIAKEGV